MVACCFDHAIAERWHSGIQIPNHEVRKKLAAHPMGESEESMREEYGFFSDAAHPNRSIIPGRHLGDGNQFVLGSIMAPNLVLVTEYCWRHLQLWFWFAAVVTHHYADVFKRRDAAYHLDYLQAAKAAQIMAPILQSEFNRLLKEAQSAQPR
jgi:hypothetical protein